MLQSAINAEKDKQKVHTDYIDERTELLGMLT
jgi:hypothetical protein